MNDRMLRVAAFIDGSYFLRVNSYYKYKHPRRSNLSFAGLMEFMRDQVSLQEGIEKRFCQVIEAHWFRGRFSTRQLQKRYPEDPELFDFITNERIVDDMFMYQGIVQHVFPLQVNPSTGAANEKGIDVWLALEAYELTVLRKFDVLVLVVGDTDFVPLVKKINGLGTRVMILGWDIETLDKKGIRHQTRTSSALLAECSYPVMMDQIIDQEDSARNPIINQLFKI